MTAERSPETRFVSGKCLAILIQDKGRLILPSVKDDPAASEKPGFSCRAYHEHLQVAKQQDNEDLGLSSLHSHSPRGKNESVNISFAQLQLTSKQATPYLNNFSIFG